eukprot:885213-Pelagomonas_calceolata.AAC.1
MSRGHAHPKQNICPSQQSMLLFRGGGDPFKKKLDHVPSHSVAPSSGCMWRVPDAEQASASPGA